MEIKLVSEIQDRPNGRREQKEEQNKSCRQICGHYKELKSNKGRVENDFNEKCALERESSAIIKADMGNQDTEENGNQSNDHG